MVKVTYIGTEIGTCPKCGERAPGHVYSHLNSEVTYWTCPVCESPSEPENVGMRDAVHQQHDTGEVPAP